MEERYEELLARVDQQEKLISELKDGSSRLQIAEGKLDELLGREEARLMAMPKPGEELPPEIRAGIACALGPLEAAIAALDAKIESHVVVRLDTHDCRLDAH